VGGAGSDQPLRELPREGGCPDGGEPRDSASGGGRPCAGGLTGGGGRAGISPTESLPRRIGAAGTQATGVGGAGEAHRLVDVGATGERVADRTTEARRSATERLDLRGMIVGLVLEENEPRILRINDTVETRDRVGDAEGAGVDLRRENDVPKVTVGATPAHHRCCQIHQRDRTVALITTGALGEVPVPHLSDRPPERHCVVGLVFRSSNGGFVDEAGIGGLREFEPLQLRPERRMAAVVGPVGVDDGQFRLRRLTPLPGEVVPHKGPVGLVELGVGEDTLGGKSELVGTGSVGPGGGRGKLRPGKIRNDLRVDGIDEAGDKLRAPRCRDIVGGGAQPENGHLRHLHAHVLEAEDAQRLLGGIRALVELAGVVAVSQGENRGGLVGHAEHLFRAGEDPLLRGIGEDEWHRRADRIRRST
jgi:hypothetical protein